ncbi:hypothetical protein [Achromobacter arsenitoxydans]|uniref:Uncharacterized protein n=1 Tax=Achromobacter arsenitoxydans SY8 TaxID=477184 RepID=H0F9K7_9BURK|nr:hypothetical protein [Achromobacter arsenitoxydans]EHK65272.1 hypothetical protein KYC_17297 [Achromobacter arsenitoxydans SY8]
MAIGERGRAERATQALLKLAKEIADSVIGEADQATVRAVFDRLCMETDTGPDLEPAAQQTTTYH